MAKTTQTRGSGNGFIWLVLAVIVGVLVWLIFGGGKKYTSLAATSRLIYPPDELTGAPVFDKNSGHYPTGESVIPIPQASGSPTCPAGWRLWREISLGYQCSPAKNFPSVN